jgi:hypothetical protein
LAGFGRLCDLLRRLAQQIDPHDVCLISQKLRELVRRKSFLDRFGALAVNKYFHTAELCPRK